MNEFSNINERISYIIETQCNGNQKKFAQIICFTPQVVFNIVSGRKTKPSFDVLNAIISSFVDIDARWLLTGKGEMLKKDTKGGISQNITGNSNIQSGNDTTVTGDCKQRVEELQMQLEECKEQLKEKDKTISQLVNLMSSK